MSDGEANSRHHAQARRPKGNRNALKHGACCGNGGSSNAGLRHTLRRLNRLCDMMRAAAKAKAEGPS